MADKERLVVRPSFEVANFPEYGEKDVRVDLIVVPVLGWVADEGGRIEWGHYALPPDLTGESFVRINLPLEVRDASPDPFIALTLTTLTALAPWFEGKKFLPKLLPAGTILEPEKRVLNLVVCAMQDVSYWYLLIFSEEDQRKALSREVFPQQEAAMAAPPQNEFEEQVLHLVYRKINQLKNIGSKFKEIPSLKKGEPGWLTPEPPSFKLEAQPEFMKSEELLYRLVRGFERSLGELRELFPEESVKRAVVDYFYTGLSDYWSKFLFTVLIEESQFGDEKEKFSPAILDLPEGIESWSDEEVLVYLFSLKELLNWRIWYETEGGSLVAILRYAHPMLPRKIQVGEMILEKCIDTFYLQVREGEPLSPREVFDAIGAEYDERVLLELKDFVFQKLIEKVTVGREGKVHRFLDVGTGTGLLKIRGEEKGFLPKGIEIFGIDVSPVMVDVARERGIGAEVADVEKDVPFPDNYFDAAIASFVFVPYWLKDNRAALSNIFRVLTEGGGFAFNVRRPEPGDLEGYIQVMADVGFEDIQYEYCQVEEEVAGFKLSIPIGFVTGKKPKKEVK